MKKNNKGFTLIELLAVIVILLVISVIAITSISAAIERSKEKQNKAKYSAIESAARVYYNAHKNSFPKIEDDNDYFEIEIDNIDLNESERTDADGNKLCGYIYVSEGDRSGELDYNFVEDVGGCNHDINGTPFYGDVDLDGMLSPSDALYVMQYVIGTKKLNKQQMLNADVNADGRITYDEAKCILKVVAGNATGGGAKPMNCNK